MKKMLKLFFLFFVVLPAIAIIPALTIKFTGISFENVNQYALMTYNGAYLFLGISLMWLFRKIGAIA